MEVGRSRLPDSSRDLGHSTSQIAAEAADAEHALRELIGDVEFAKEHAPDQMIHIQFDCARKAIRLRETLPRLEKLLGAMKQVAGEKALKEAEAPVQFAK